MLPSNFKNLVNENTVECETIEIKEGFNPEVIIRSICAFANDFNNWGGGHIIIGFKEDSGKPVFPPEGLEIKQIDAVQKKIRELCQKLEPQYNPVIKPYDVDNKMVLVLWVAAGDARPYKAPTTLAAQSQRRYYIRQGSSTVLANRNEEERLLEQSAKIKFESRVHHYATINDFDINLIHAYLKQTNSSLYPDCMDMKRDALFHSLLIVKGPQASLRPLNFGLLFFSNEPHKHFPGALVDVVIFSDQEGTEFIEKSFIGPLNKQIVDVLEYVKTNIIKEKTRKVNNQAETHKITNYSYQAIEEAVVNAVYHRSYEIDNKTEVRVFSDRLQIVNFPGPIPPVNEQTILQDRIDVREYRNPVIGKFLRDYKLCEERGTGIATIRKEMTKNGAAPPEFDFGDNNTHFMIIFKIHPDWESNINNNSQDIAQASSFAGTILSNNEQIILEQCTNGTTLVELKKIFENNISNNELKLILKKLQDEGYIVRKQFTRAFGLIKLGLFRSTKKGNDKLKQSF